MKKLRIALIILIGITIHISGFLLSVRQVRVDDWPTGTCWEMPMRWDKNINTVTRNLSFKIPLVGWVSIGRQGNLIYCDKIKVGEGFLPSMPSYRCVEGYWFVFDAFDGSRQYEHFGTLDEAISPISFEDCVENMK